MSKGEASAYYREGYYIDIKRTDGTWTIGVVKAVDPVRGYNVYYEDNGKAVQVWFGKGSERIAPFRQACNGKELNSVLRKAGVGVRETVTEVRSVLGWAGVEPMALVQAYRGNLLYRVLDLMEMQPQGDAEKELWQETLTQVIGFCLQWLQKHIPRKDIWTNLLKGKDAYLSSLEQAEASCWPELFETLGKVLLVREPSAMHQRQYAISSAKQQEAFDLLTSAHASIPFHMLGSYPVWDLFPIFATSGKQQFLEMLDEVVGKTHIEPRYFDLSALNLLLEKLNWIMGQLNKGPDSRLETMIIDIAKGLGRDRDRLEARIQSIRVYTLALDRHKQGKGLQAANIAEALLDVTRSHFAAETNPEAIALTFPILSFLADHNKLSPEDIRVLLRPQGHESVVNAKFQLATKLAPALHPAILSTVVEVWSLLPLSHATIAAMKEFTIQANSQSYRNPCFLPLFQKLLVRQETEESAGEVLAALTDIVQLPAFYRTQSEMLESLASALKTSGVETIFSFGHLFRKCDKRVIADLQQKSPALLNDIIDLALKHERLSTKDCPPTVVLSTVLGLLLDVARALGKEGMSREHINRLHSLISDPVVEERAEQYFEWLRQAASDPQSCSSDLTAFCSRLLIGTSVPQSLYESAGIKTITFFQRIFLERNSHFIAATGDDIIAITKKWGDNYLLGQWTVFQLALQQRKAAVQEYATAFLTQLLFRSRAEIPSLLPFYLSFTFERLPAVAPLAQLSTLKSILAVVEYYEQLSEQYESYSGPLSVNLTGNIWTEGNKTLCFPQNAKLGHVRKSLNRPYYSVALIWQGEWYSFVNDDLPLSRYGNPAYFTVKEGDYYAHIDPLDAIANGYANALVDLINAPSLQLLVWQLLRKVVASCPTQFAIFFGGLESVILGFQNSSARQLIALALVEAKQPEQTLILKLVLPLLKGLVKSETQLASLEPELRRSYCCKLVNVTGICHPVNIESQAENDRILDAFFALYRVYISTGVPSDTAQEPFNWLSLISQWATTHPCAPSLALRKFLEQDIIRTVFFTNVPRQLQSEFAVVLSQLSNAPFSVNGEIDQRLTSALDACLSGKQADTEVYFSCLREAIARGRSDSSAIMPKILNLLENMSELTVSESTLEGLFMVLGQAVHTQRLAGTEKLAHRLTTHYLFPSAENKYPLCTSVGSQQAGFDLLTEICAAAPAALDVVLRSLERFHTIRSWRKSSFKSWVVPAQEEKSLEPFVGLRNLGATCYLNSVLQQFRMLHHFRDSITRLPDLHPGVTAEVVKLLLKLQFSAKPYVQTKGLCSVYKNWDGEAINPREQMDVEEFLGGVLTKMTEELKPMGQAEAVQRIFEITSVNTIHGLAPCSHQSDREETHFTLPIEVKNKRSVRESLDTLVQKEMMEGDSAYSCDQCQRKVSAEKHQRFRLLPEVLVFALRRFEYSVELGRRKKINDYFDFEDELDMSPYLYTSEMVSIQSMRKSALHLYHLKGIIIHIGEADAGHYVALARSNGRWVEFNDTQVRVVDDTERREMSVGQQEGPLAQTSAYLLIYQRGNESEKDTMQTIRQHSGSEAREISRKNEEYLYKKSVFRPQYRNFVLGLLTKLQQSERLLKFAVSDFLTIHSRCQNAEPDLLFSLYQHMLQFPSVQHWFAHHFTSSAALKEFILECPHLLVRKFLAALFYKSVENASEEDRVALLQRLQATVSRLEVPMTEKYASLFELLYCIARGGLQEIANSELPAMMVAQILKQKVTQLPVISDAPVEWGGAAGQTSSEATPSEAKPNCAFQLAILQSCLARLRPEIQQQISSKAFMQEAVSGASNKFGGLKLASIYLALSENQPELLPQYLACLADYFQACDYDRYRVGTVQVRKLVGLQSSAEEGNRVMDMLMEVLDRNKGFVLAAATIVRLIYKLVTTRPVALQWYNKSGSANKAIEAWEREYRRFGSGSSGLSLTKSPQYYQPSIYQVVPDLSSMLQALIQQRFPSKEADSDVETYEVRWGKAAEMLLSGNAVPVQVEKNMELLFHGTYMEAGTPRKNFIATDDDRLMPEHTKIPTNF